MTRAVVISGMFASLALLMAGCNRDTEAPQPIRPVLSRVIEPQTSGSAAAVGTVEPRFKTDLSFRVLGRLIARPVNVGDSVGQGQIIAAIDATALELAVRSAKAELSRTQAQFENANATEQRQRTLITTDTTTKAALENAQQIRAGAEATVARAQANLTKALEQLGYATVKTDFAGVVTAVGADVGQVVSPGQTVVTVARPDIREAVVDIGPDFPVPLRIGLPFTVILQLLPTIQIDGKIREIAPQADPVTRTVRVRIALSNPPATFRLGTTVAATLADEQPSTLRVPASAVLTKDGENFVWIVDLPARTVSLHKVDLAEDEGGFRVIGGLEAGTRVVTAGIHSLKQGQKVRIEQDLRP
jgi:membrane fusion protein, multidrug efflux system